MAQTAMTPDPMNPAHYSLTGKRVWVAGHNGMVGSALVRRLAEEDVELLTVTKGECDLRDQQAVSAWMKDTRPQTVFLAAAKVGGILANDTYPADFLYDNLMIEANVIRAAHQCGVKKLLLLGSSCIYPKFAAQPISEHELLTGSLEPTNEWYAIAKIAGIKLCQAFRRQHGCDFIAAMPTNLYGPNDNFDLETAHVVPALMHRMHEAKLAGAAEVVVWGSGTPRRELLHVADCADALVHMMKTYSGYDHLNVGSGKDTTIRNLAELIGAVVGFEGTLRFDPSRPDGTPRKLLNVDRMMDLGWEPKIGLKEGLTSVYDWFRANAAQN